MFGKKTEDQGPAAAPEPKTPDRATPLPLKRGGAPSAASAPRPARQTVIRPEIVRRGRDYTTLGGADDHALGTYGDGKTLIVGRDIALSGAINSCEKLVVEGRVEANIADCREIDIAETGTFKGEAEIDVAEISGAFEGTLVARELLLVRASGRISGTIRYGHLEVERGGKIEGDMRLYTPEADDGTSAGAV